MIVFALVSASMAMMIASPALRCASFHSCGAAMYCVSSFANFALMSPMALARRSLPQFDLLVAAGELGRAGEVPLAFVVAAGIGFKPFGLALAFAVDVGAVDLDRLFVPAGVADVVLCHFDQLPCGGVVFV